MLLRRFTDFVLQNRLQAMAAAFVIAFIPVIGMISILIAALVTLRKGAFEGALVLLAALLPYVISFGVSSSTQDSASITTIVLLIFLLSNILTWVFAILLRKFNDWSFILELAALLGIALVAIVHLVYPNILDWWAFQLNAYFAKTAAAVSKIEPDTSATVQAQAQAIMAAKYFATGFVVVSVLFNALLQLLLARWWQAVIFNPGGLRQELYQIRMANVAAIVFAVGIILAYFGNNFALDAMPVLYMTFFVAGLSLLHNLANLTKAGFLWLILLYVIIMWLFPLSIVIIAIIALFDTGFNFRKRFLL